MGLLEELNFTGDSASESLETARGIRIFIKFLIDLILVITVVWIV